MTCLPGVCHEGRWEARSLGGESFVESSEDATLQVFPGLVANPNNSLRETYDAVQCMKNVKPAFHHQHFISFNRQTTVGSPSSTPS